MVFEIDPYTGVGPIRFGMTAGEVRSMVGGELVTFRKGPFASGDTDDFVGQGTHVHYAYRSLRGHRVW
jgi:hypothetical protein